MKKLVLLSIPFLIISSQSSFAVNFGNNPDDYAYEAPAVVHRIVNPRAYAPQPVISKDAPIHKQKALLMRAANAICLGSLALLAIELPSIVGNYSTEAAQNIVMGSLSVIALIHLGAKALVNRL